MDLYYLDMYHEHNPSPLPVGATNIPVSLGAKERLTERLAKRKIEREGGLGFHSPKIISEPMDTNISLVREPEVGFSFEVEDPSPQQLPPPPPPQQQPPTPKWVFIVPYRDREQQQAYFDNHMRKIILMNQDPKEYQIVYVHQQDNREFNRGAMKNLGFLYIKQKFPQTYSSIVLIFNDVDTMPYTPNFLNYNTIPGIVKHFYGFTFALGGIVSIVASDFERIGGFPNFWAWGFEDNALQQRVLGAGLRIDRSQFYPLQDKNILQLKDGLLRSVNRTEFDKFKSSTTEGWKDISQIQWMEDLETGFLHVTHFLTPSMPTTPNTTHDLRNGSVPFMPKSRRRGGSMLF